MSGSDLLIVFVVIVGAGWVVVSIIDDLVHRRRLKREGERAEVIHLVDHVDDPCVWCDHARQAHRLLARHARGACMVEGCVCAGYIPNREAG